MPTVELLRCPVAPALAPAQVHVREWGSGPAVVLLHGGWGYEAYSFDAAARRLAVRFHVLAPDRVGYGRSGAGLLGELPDGFHERMAEETMLVLDALGARDAALWGHSDGAVVAAWAAIRYPDRVRGLVLESVHHHAAKARSVEFFETAAGDPERFGERVVRDLVRDHGAAWRQVVGAGGRAWLRIIEEGRRGRTDLYGGRLGEIRAPTLLLHGRHDPRTEPGELEAVAAAVAGARVELLDAGHGPHASPAAEVAIELVARFLAGSA